MKCDFIIQKITENCSAFIQPLLYMLLYLGGRLATHTYRKAFISQDNTMCLTIQHTQRSTDIYEKLIVSSTALCHLVTCPTVAVFLASSDTLMDLPCSFHT